MVKARSGRLPQAEMRDRRVLLYVLENDRYRHADCNLIRVAIEQIGDHPGAFL
jgi:hypothetical protein